MPLWITAELVIALDEYGRRFLADRNIHREPVVWAPPDAGRHLAVVPEEAVDISAIHGWIGEHQPRSFAGLLRKFDLDIDTARYLLEEFPAPNASMNA